MMKYGIATLIIMSIFGIAPLWAAPKEAVVLVDLTNPAILEEAKRAIQGAVNSAPEETCLQVIGITDRSFSSPRIILERDCIPTRLFILDPKPLEAKQRMSAQWEKRSQELSPTDQGANARQSNPRSSTPQLTRNQRVSDVFGAFAYAALILNSRNSEAEKLLVVFSPLRHNAGGISFHCVTEIEAELLKRVQERGLIPSLKGVKVTLLGVHTQGKEERYYNSLRRFYEQYFQAAGASIETFSPTSHLALGTQTASQDNHAPSLARPVQVGMVEEQCRDKYQKANEPGGKRKSPQPRKS